MILKPLIQRYRLRILIIAAIIIALLMQDLQKGEIPRFVREFIGKGHQLEGKKRERRRIQKEEKSLANRVLFLEKEQLRAQQSYHRKQQELSKIIQIAERQAQQREFKEKLLLERERQIQKAKQENRLRRQLHKQNQDHVIQDLESRNKLDYIISKKMLQEFESRKKLEKLEDLTQRKQRYMTLNLMKEKGRSRIDKYFKKRNSQHNKLYEQKINLEDSKIKQKADTIKKLEHIEDVLRKKLQQSTMRVSRMDEVINGVSKAAKRMSLSRSVLQNSPGLITSMDRQLLVERKQETQNSSSKGTGSFSESRAKKKGKNKSIHRYGEYQLF